MFRVRHSIQATSVYGAATHVHIVTNSNEPYYSYRRPVSVEYGNTAHSQLSTADGGGGSNQSGKEGPQTMKKNDFT